MAFLMHYERRITGFLLLMACLLVQAPAAAQTSSTIKSPAAAMNTGQRPATAVQTLSLEECHRLARENYPLVQKLDLISKSSDYSLANASKLHLPQLSIHGQASYQSETVDLTEVVGRVLPPGVELPSISKDQYKIQAELSQSLYDGGAVSRRRDQIEVEKALEKQEVEIALYALRERVNQLYFSVLLMATQLEQNQTRIVDLENAAGKVSAALEQGTAFRSNLDELKAELVSAEMTAIQLRSSRTAYLRMLGLLTGKDLPEDIHLEMPVEAEAHSAAIDRPELALYGLKNDLLDVSEREIKSALLPKLDLFAQGAYGRPTLNFISDEFGPWYLAGLRLTWNLGSLYTLKNDKRNLNIQRKTVEAEKETFLLNTRLSMQEEDQEIQKYRELLAADKKAIKLRASVKNAAEAQLENGVITTSDYISRLNAENLAQQTLLYHKIALLQAQYKYRHNQGRGQWNESAAVSQKHITD